MNSLTSNATRDSPLYCIDTLMRHHQSRKRLSEKMRSQAMQKARTQEVENFQNHLAVHQRSVGNDIIGILHKPKLEKEGSADLEPSLIQFTQYVCGLSNNTAVMKKNLSDCVRQPKLHSKTSLNENRPFHEKFTRKASLCKKSKELEKNIHQNKGQMIESDKSDPRRNNEFPSSTQGLPVIDPSKLLKPFGSQLQNNESENHRINAPLYDKSDGKAIYRTKTEEPNLLQAAPQEGRATILNLKSSRQRTKFLSVMQSNPMFQNLRLKPKAKTTTYRVSNKGTLCSLEPVEFHSKRNRVLDSRTIIGSSLPIKRTSRKSFLQGLCLGLF